MICLLDELREKCVSIIAYIIAAVIMKFKMMLLTTLLYARSRQKED